MKADRRLYLTADRQRVVEEGDAEASFLLAPEGEEIPEDEVERLGLKERAKPHDKARKPGGTK